MFKLIANGNRIIMSFEGYQITLTPPNQYTVKDSTGKIIDGKEKDRIISRSLAYIRTSAAGYQLLTKDITRDYIEVTLKDLEIRQMVRRRAYFNGNFIEAVVDAKGGKANG
ncbi:MAG: hypothetical protein ACYCX4_00015 [Bacillota bacterium]